MAEENTKPAPGSEDTSNNSSANISRQHSFRGNRHKVKFSNVDSNDEEKDLDGGPHTRGSSDRRKSVPEIRIPGEEDVADHVLISPDRVGRTSAAAAHAQNRANRLANRLSNLVSSSKTTTLDSAANTPLATPPQGYASPNTSPPTKPLNDWIVNVDDIPLASLDKEKDKRPYAIHDDTTDDDTDDDDEPKPLKRTNENVEEAKRLVRTLTAPHNNLSGWQNQPRSGTQTPAIDKRLHDIDYIPPPDEYRPGIFGAILSSKLADLKRGGITRPRYYDDPSSGAATPKHSHSPKDLYSYSRGHSRVTSESGAYHDSTPSSGRATPSSKRPKWYDKGPANQSTGSMATLVAQASMTSAAPVSPGISDNIPRPPMNRNRSSNSMIATAVDMIKHPGHHFHHKHHSSSPSIRAEEIRVIQDVASIIACRKYLKKLARVLMAVGAPSHRLEEYLKTSARALNIDGDFLYVPGAMLVSINDPITMSTEVTLVRESQNVDLSRFEDVFAIYKCVIHGKYAAEEGLDEIELIMRMPEMHRIGVRILAYGIAAIAVGPFAFSARPVDFAPSFVLGCTLGVLQLIVVNRSAQFAHVFEVLAAVFISFAARGLGSIYVSGHEEPVFCFSAIAQSSIALILPGYTVLCSALELQSKNLVSGSVKMVYAIIYSLFLGFGILIGTVVMGLIYPGAQSDVTCHIPSWWNSGSLNYTLIYARFIWVPIFAICLAIINQAKWHQVPIMTLIAFCGYQANFWISTQVMNNVQVANAIGAFAIGVMANLYSRFFHGLAAAAMLPAIFVQVPSGLAASGSLVAGITSANQITGNATGISVINNGTAGFLDAQDGSSAAADVYGGTIFNVGYGMIQVAIGISVGLYLSALVVYPIGKRRSGLFSF
ncbi:uncharacterized protein Z518_02656 [Rhinocladiella mackenziei CBS 650.93]|uniref:DUF1212 domain membrane protein Prm10 n=1 Tax=Rhinocladiella mackenziei CBS 650.93 TaxID=1442369 RepID=A0A0D2IXG2_9EURO|nr:uncharacterized protein Z518_02656 [Rhinocladiella mackenziei CBS 650.93]KIX08001.1 hypothetical protein Z518_02656 [Rhinocladiella mackenziei CBS 650.93]